MKIKPLQNEEITVSFTGACKSAPSRGILKSQICILALFAKINFSRKNPVIVEILVYFAYAKMSVINAHADVVGLNVYFRFHEFAVRF